MITLRTTRTLANAAAALLWLTACSASGDGTAPAATPASETTTGTTSETGDEPTNGLTTSEPSPTSDVLMRRPATEFTVDDMTFDLEEGWVEVGDYSNGDHVYQFGEISDGIMSANSKQIFTRTVDDRHTRSQIEYLVGNADDFEIAEVYTDSGIGFHYSFNEVVPGSSYTTHEIEIPHNTGGAIAVSISSPDAVAAEDIAERIVTEIDKQ